MRVPTVLGQGAFTFGLIALTLAVMGRGMARTLGRLDTLLAGGAITLGTLDYVFHLPTLAATLLPFASVLLVATFLVRYVRAVRARTKSG